PAIQTGPTCERCEDENLGPLLAATVANFNGEFTLEGRIPVGVPFRIVVKAGKWRRVSEVTLSQGQACSTVNLTGAQALRLPANQSDGLAGTHFPFIAISTGQIDAMECVLYKMGFDRSEFTVRGRGDGRIH